MNTNDIRGAWPPFTPEARRANTRVVNALNEFGQTRGMTSSQTALAWMMSKHPFSSSCRYSARPSWHT
jgi:aryl-alcohol dehydrogenase-like predicted oxidoreductase